MGSLSLGQAALWREGDDEGFVEVEDIDEVLDGVGVLFAEHLLFDQEKDHLADVAGLGESPFGHEGGGHGAKFLEGEVAKADDKFAA